MKNDLKYDAFGNLDADYYVEKAYELRRQYYAQLTAKAVAGVKAFFVKLSANRTVKTSAQPQH
ncbi:RSP_7527 family protein [Marinomonas sp.]|uniref:RSP_7527 family protein n=1 Tax=Marinomonas sp. TaxID=1904862 RepID=UPI003BAA0CDA